MKFDQISIADVAVAEIVVADAVAGRLGRDDFLDVTVDSRIGGVHQSADTAPHETEAGDQDVEGGSDGEERIPVKPPGEMDEAERDEHTEAGPAVGEHVVSVGLENDRAAFASGAHEVPAEDAVEHRGQRGESQADREV